MIRQCAHRMSTFTGASPFTYYKMISQALAAASIAAQSSIIQHGKRLEISSLTEAPELRDAHTFTLLANRTKPIKGFLWDLGNNRTLFAAGSPRVISFEDVSNVAQLCHKPLLVPSTVWNCFDKSRSFHLEFGVEHHEMGSASFQETMNTNTSSQFSAIIATLSLYFNLTSVSALHESALNTLTPINILSTDEEAVKARAIVDASADQRPFSPTELLFLYADTISAGSLSQLEELHIYEPEAVKVNLAERSERLADQIICHPQGSFTYVDARLLPGQDGLLERLRGLKSPMRFIDS